MKSLREDEKTKMKLYFTTGTLNELHSFTYKYLSFSALSGRFLRHVSGGNLVL